MKRKLFAALIAAGAALILSCTKAEEPEVDPKIAVSVSDIADNQATVDICLTEGNYYKVMAVYAVRKSLVPVNLESEIQLIKYVKANGVVVDEVPHTEYVANLRADDVYVSLAVAFNKKGRVNTSAMVEFTATGAPEGFSEDNDAGKLDENVL